jgi:Cu/Zn superoxide dismutase
MNPTGGSQQFALRTDIGIIHAGADDYVSEPAGNAGDRMACGVVTP